MGESRGVYRLLVRKRGERDHLEELGLDGRIIIITWTFRKWDVMIWTGSSWLSKGTGGGDF